MIRLARLGACVHSRNFSALMNSRASPFRNHQGTGRIVMFYRSAYINKFRYAVGYNFFSSNARKSLQVDQSFVPNLTALGSKFPRVQYKYLGKSLDAAKRAISDGKSNPFNNITQLPKSIKSEPLSPVETNCTTKQKPQPFDVALIEKKKVVASDISQRSKIKDFVKLTKPNLTILVTLSSICSYAISPNSLSVAELAFLTAGTALCSGSANAINMGREPEFDRKMSRTSMRPVVTGRVSSEEAFTFAGLTGLFGTSILCFGVNPTVAFLGVLNIVLYGWIYTSLKRVSILNTWVGAIVGAIPPLMGWAASTSLLHPGGWCLAALLYAWQFPHFNSLSHNIAEQYKGAGYVMAASENPKLNARVALRYSLLMFPICIGLSYFGVTDWVFPIDSGLANFWLTMLAYRFWRQQRTNHAKKSTPSKFELQAASLQARQLFWCSVWQLPAVLVLAMLHKKGQWDRLWALMGFTDENVSTKRLK